MKIANKPKPKCGWLFPDNISGTEFQLINPDTVAQTKDGRLIPSMVVYGHEIWKSDNSIHQREMYLLTSLIENYDELVEKLGIIPDGANVTLKISVTPNNKFYVDIGFVAK